MEEAGRTLDWDVTVFDGKFESNRQLSGIEQALADKADGMSSSTSTARRSRPALQQAEGRRRRGGRDRVPGVRPRC